MQQTRYFEKATMLVKYAVLRLFLKTVLISTKEMIADIFTKAVDKDTFILMRKHLLNLGARWRHGPPRDAWACIESGSNLSRPD